MKFNSLFYGLILLCAFLSFSYLPINPIYLLGGGGIIFGMFSINMHQVDKVMFIFLLYFLLSCIVFCLGEYYFIKYAKDVVFLSSFLYLYSILIGAQAIVFGRRISYKSRVYVYNYVFNILIFFMSLDLFFRVINVGELSSDFYDYKKYGIFYFDSNFTGLIIALFLMFSIFLKQRSIYNIGFFRSLFLFLLLLFTFSRAAILAFLLSYFLLICLRRFFLPLFMLASSLFVIIFYNMLVGYLSGESFVDIDGSFNSKFYIISLALDNYKYLPDVNKLFGIGMANFSYYSNGIFAHNILVTLVYEFGIVGTSLFIMFLFFMYIKIGKDVLFLYLPLIIGGFSLFSAYMPFFFILLACLYIETKMG